jgi:hypothetical protein
MRIGPTTRGGQEIGIIAPEIAGRQIGGEYESVRSRTPVSELGWRLFAFPRRGGFLAFTSQIRDTVHTADRRFCTSMSGTVPTTCVEFCIWQVTAEQSQVDPLIAETASEVTGLVDSAAARFILKAALSWPPLSLK